MPDHQGSPSSSELPSKDIDGLDARRANRGNQARHDAHEQRGFDLHAAMSIAAADRDGCERLSRYLLRPAVAQDRLALLDDGNVRLELRSEWSDGTTHLEFEPSELIGRLASLVPKPRSRLYPTCFRSAHGKVQTH